jgi:hypothetical protein
MRVINLSSSDLRKCADGRWRRVADRPFESIQYGKWAVDPDGEVYWDHPWLNRP